MITVPTFWRILFGFEWDFAAGATSEEILAVTTFEMLSCFIWIGIILRKKLILK